MRKAYFTNMFCGVESPESGALRAIKKSFNLKRPILDAIDTFNQYGMEVAVGLIMGFDTDTPQTPQTLAEFIHASQTPVHTLNILYALPKTPIYNRLAEAGRIVSDEGRDSNVKFLRPYDELIADWLDLISKVYEPEALYQRYATQAIKTYPNRRRPKYPLRQAYTTQSSTSLFNFCQTDLACRNPLRLPQSILEDVPNSAYARA